MFDFFKKNKPTQDIKENQEYTIPKSKFDFVEQYVVVDPDNVLHCGYEMWEMCDMTPVAYDNNNAGGWVNTVELPSVWVQKFLKFLSTKATPEIRKDPTQRLISVINMKDNHKIYIVPYLGNKHGSYIISENEDDKEHSRDWVLYVTPEINRAIVEQVKIRSRLK